MLCKSNSKCICKKAIPGSVGGSHRPTCFMCSLLETKETKAAMFGAQGGGHAKCRGGGEGRQGAGFARTNLRMPGSSIFRRFESTLRDEDDENLEGFMVLEERPLSVLELVTELKREVPSFVMVASS